LRAAGSPYGNEAGSVVSNFGKCSGHQHRLLGRAAHRRDPADFVDGRSHHREIKPLRTPHVAIEHLADVQAEIHVGDRKAGCRAALIQLGDAPARGHGGREGRVASARAIIGRENGEHTGAHKFENVTALFVNRRNDHIGIVVEQRNDVFRRHVGDPREAAQVAEPQDRVDAVGDAAHNPAAQDAPAGVASEVRLHQRSGHACQCDGFDCESEKRRKTLQRCDMFVPESPRIPRHPDPITKPCFFLPPAPESDSDFRLAPAVSRRATNPCFFFIHET
jgi:hypothetical protein